MTVTWPVAKRGVPLPVSGERSPARPPTTNLSPLEALWVGTLNPGMTDDKDPSPDDTNPDEILDRIDQLVAETSSERGETTPITDGVDPIAQKHRDAIRRGAEEDSDE